MAVVVMWVYMLRYADNTLDVGHTRNVTERERVRNAGEGLQERSANRRQVEWQHRSLSFDTPP